MYNDPQLKNIANENFDAAIERAFIAASKNEVSFIGFELKRESLDRTFIRLQIAKSLIMAHRLEILRDSDHFK